MVEVSTGFFVGNDDAYNYGIKKYGSWAIVHACKEPYHRQFVGYVSLGAPKGSPEYYYAIRGKELALNMVDVDNPEWFNTDMIDLAIGFMIKYSENHNILIHCNQGESRSPSLALLYLVVIGVLPKNFSEAEREFMKLYKYYNPKQGIRQHLIRNWEKYLRV